MKRKKTSNNYSIIILIVAVLTLILLYKNRKTIKEKFSDYSILVRGVETGGTENSCNPSTPHLEYSVSRCAARGYSVPCCGAEPPQCTRDQRNEQRCRQSRPENERIQEGRRSFRRNLIELGQIGLSEQARENMLFDGAYLKSRKLYLFKQDKYWRFTMSGARHRGETLFTQNRGYPKYISNIYKAKARGYNNLDITNIDGVFRRRGTDYSYKNKKQYFFKDNKYYKYTSGKGVRGGRKNISIWSGIPNNIDAVAQIKDDYIIFFKRHQYWLYLNNEGRVHPLHNGVPISRILGSDGPPVVDAAAADNLYIYVFHNNRYWQITHLFVRSQSGRTPLAISRNIYPPRIIQYTE